MLALYQCRFLLAAFLVLLQGGCGTMTNIQREMPQQQSVLGKSLMFDSIHVQVRTEVVDTAEEVNLREGRHGQF
jgi:hypothetical protein